MTRVALLWHMHQPFYQDLATGEHVLPWVRLHALKDYWGMVALLREFPRARMTFNLVPSMLAQVQAFAREEARDLHLEIGLKPAERLTPDERLFCIDHFFYAQKARMVDPYPRYTELWNWRGENGAALDPQARVAQFSTGDLRDLQVWHKLVWIDALYHERDARVRVLVEKGRGFTEDDKVVLRAVELELLRAVVPEYRDAASRGQVELSTSPFYHPILPLLCDTDIYRRTHPDSRMPRERFARPEDALEQLTRAVAFHQDLFGTRPAGLWPSEGSVSPAMVPLVARTGFGWMATDEAILARTLGRGFGRDGAGSVDHPEVLYRPYRVGAPAADVACGFRDHTLSDLIGFSYASWSAEAAADDFIARLVEAGRRFSAATGGGDATIFVILDGENAWEHYDQQGRPFLRALYRRLDMHPELRTVTMSEACAEATERLPDIFPGSWINGDFYIWIGHADDHRAWSQVADARRMLDAPGVEVSAPALARAREEMLIAEGSDWFWWYGDDHSSDHDRVFDELFRRHLQNVYRALDKPIPDELFVSNITTQPAAAAIQAPTGFVHPVIDGENTNYFEWVGAGSVELDGTAGAMHEVAPREPAVQIIEFGFDLAHLYIRVTGARPLREMLLADRTMSVNFLEPAGVRLQVHRTGEETAIQLLERQADGTSRVRACEGGKAAVGRMLELAVPFACLGLSPGAPFAFVIALSSGATEIEHQPQLRPVQLTVPERDFVARHWTA